MSATLAGLLQPRILSVLRSFGSEEYNGPTDPAAAQAKMAQELSQAIAQAVQQYLLISVTVTPGQAVVTAGGPTNQVGSTTTPGKLTVP
jgi:outer membrane protein OmpA-like peptidoglycan-associated protein